VAYYLYAGPSLFKFVADSEMEFKMMKSKHVGKWASVYVNQAFQRQSAGSDLVGAIAKNVLTNKKHGAFYNLIFLTGFDEVTHEKVYILSETDYIH